MSTVISEEGIYICRASAKAVHDFECDLIWYEKNVLMNDERIQLFRKLCAEPNSLASRPEQMPYIYKLFVLSFEMFYHIIQQHPEDPSSMISWYIQKTEQFLSLQVSFFSFS